MPQSETELAERLGLDTVSILIRDKIHGFSRRFKTEPREDDYQIWRLGQNRSRVRLSILGALVLYALFLVLDLYLLEKHGGSVSDVQTVYLIRGAGCGLMLLLLLLSFTPIFWRQKWETALLTLGSLVIGLSIPAISYLVDPLPVYYQGLTLVLMFSAFLFFLPVRSLLWIALAFLAAYNFAEWSERGTTPRGAIAANNCVLMAAAAICVFGGRVYQRSDRAVYWQTTSLEQKRADLEREKEVLAAALARSQATPAAPAKPGAPMQPLPSSAASAAPATVPQAPDSTPAASRAEGRPRDKVFISYSHKDGKWLDLLKGQLKGLDFEEDRLEIWDDSMIGGGDLWPQAIDEALQESKVAVLLVSWEYLASDFIRQKELAPILKEREHRRVLWVLLDACHWEETGLQEIQSPQRPLIRLDYLAEDEQKEVMKEVSLAIRKAANEA